MKIIIEKITPYIIAINLIWLTSSAGVGFLGELHSKFGFFVQAILLCLFFLCIAIDRKTDVFKDKINTITSVLIFMFAYIYFKQTINSLYFLMYIQFLIYFLVIYNALIYFKNKDKTVLKVVAYYIVIELTVLMIVSVFYSIKFDTTFLRDSMHGSNIEFKEKYNMPLYFLIGNYGTAYAAPMLLFFSGYQVHRKKFFYIIPLLASLLTIVTCGYNNCIFSCVAVMLLVLFIFLYKESGIKKTAIVMIFSTAIVSLLLVVVTKNNLLGTHFNNILNSLLNFFTGKDKSILDYYKNAKIWSETNYDFKEFSLIYPEYFKSDFAARMMVYLRPIVGIIKNKFLYNPNNIICGEHSTVLDTLSILGMISVMYFYAFFKVYNESLKKANVNLKLLIIVYVFAASLIDRMLIIEVLLFPMIVIPTLAYGNYEK